MLGHGYGRKFSNPTNNRIYRIRSGQALWEELTGDPDFYLKIISLMSNAALEHRTQFEAEWIRALKRFEDEFLINFGNPDNSINWEKLLRFNSGKEKVAWMSRKTLVTSTEDEADNDYTEEVDPTLENDEI